MLKKSSYTVNNEEEAAEKKAPPHVGTASLSAGYKKKSQPIFVKLLPPHFLKKTHLVAK